ncbi:hypothetical protein MJL33_28930, partial [Salmonella enterica subsp. enterica serovar Kentucky]|nr:hypothetical protein [Salmonella enterica subsp. enterica serovar Kentucky]
DTVTIDLNACIPYNPDHNLDEDSWFKIEGFSQKEFCIELLKKKYRDLVVRVAGYSAFFTALSPDAQDDIIARTEHML